MCPVNFDLRKPFSAKTNSSSWCVCWLCFTVTSILLSSAAPFRSMWWGLEPSCSAVFLKRTWRRCLFPWWIFLIQCRSPFLSGRCRLLLLLSKVPCLYGPCFCCGRSPASPSNFWAYVSFSSSCSSLSSLSHFSSSISKYHVAPLLLHMACKCPFFPQFLYS